MILINHTVNSFRFLFSMPWQTLEKSFYCLILFLLILLNNQLYLFLQFSFNRNVIAIIFTFKLEVGFQNSLLCLQNFQEFIEEKSFYGLAHHHLLRKFRPLQLQVDLHNLHYLMIHLIMMINHCYHYYLIHLIYLLLQLMKIKPHFSQLKLIMKKVMVFNR